jgi:biopolymer transport protein ExbD
MHWRDPNEPAPHSDPPAGNGDAPAGGDRALGAGEGREVAELLTAELSAPSRGSLLSRRKREEAEMDMTPMVDVTFLLLIFFMVTASFTMQKSLNIPKPESDQPSTAARSIHDFENNPDYVVVRIDPYNTYHITASAWDEMIEAPSEQELRVRLRQARQGDDQGNVPIKMLVIAHGDALHERVVTAIDAANDAGIEEVQLLTTEEDVF